MSTYLLVVGLLCSFVFSARGEDVMEQVEKEMPVLKGDTWIKMSDDEKISFIWGAGHIVSIEEVLARDNPGLKKSNTFVNRIMEAHNKKPMTMSQVAKYVDDYYQANPDKLDKPVIEVIWYGTIVPRTTTTDESGKSAK
jgi:hypothetical protein